MSYRFFGILISITLLIQIAFSFYYSSEVINQNNLLDKNQTELNLLEKENLELEKNFSVLTSLSNLQKWIKTRTYFSVSQSININSHY